MRWDDSVQKDERVWGDRKEAVGGGKVKGGMKGEGERKRKRVAGFRLGGRYFKPSL